MLTEKQKSLLSHFADTGNIYSTRIHTGVSMSEFNEWMCNKDFADKYNQVKSNALTLLNDESNMMARKYVHNILTQGCVKTTKQKTDADGFTTYEEIESYIPTKYLDYAIFKDSIESAIATLSSEGILPDIVARRLIQQINANRNETKKIFDMEDNKAVSDKRVLSLIKTALGLQPSKND